MKATIQTVHIPANTRILVASDLHGHGAWLDRLLARAGFSDDDYLFLVGDYLERGPENLATLRRVMELCKRPNVYATIGNFDVNRLEMFDQEPEAIQDFNRVFSDVHGSTLFEEMCAELGLPCKTLAQIAWARDRLPMYFRAELDFLRSLPTVIETPRFRFVHGGIPTADLAALDLSDAWPYLKRDRYLDEGVTQDKWTIVGHWPACLYRQDRIDLKPFVCHGQRIIDIDGGAGVKRTGQVNLFIIPGAGEDRFECLHYDAFPRYRALDPQSESAVSGSINYADPWVEVLEERRGLTRVRRLSDGYEMWASCPMVEQDGRVRPREDCTDYRHGIVPGDEVKLIREDALGAYVKKDGVLGYYSGRLERIF